LAQFVSKYTGIILERVLINSGYNMQVTEFTNKQNHTHRQPKTIHYLLSPRRDKIIIIIIIIISTTMFMVLSSWQSHCESSPGSFDECRMAPSGRRPKTKPDDLGCESACTGCQNLHPPSPFIITQPES